MKFSFSDSKIASSYFASGTQPGATLSAEPLMPVPLTWENVVGGSVVARGEDVAREGVGQALHVLLVEHVAAEA